MSFLNINGGQLFEMLERRKRTLFDEAIERGANRRDASKISERAMTEELNFWMKSNHGNFYEDTNYKILVTRNAYDDFDAMIVRVDSDGEEQVVRGFGSRSYKTEKSAVSAMSKYIEKNLRG